MRADTKGYYIKLRPFDDMTAVQLRLKNSNIMDIPFEFRFRMFVLHNSRAPEVNYSAGGTDQDTTNEDSSSAGSVIELDSTARCIPKQYAFFCCHPGALA